MADANSTNRHVRPLLVQGQDNHLEVEERLVDVPRLPQCLPPRCRLVHALRPGQVAQVQLAPPHAVLRPCTAPATLEGESEDAVGAGGGLLLS